MKIFGDQVDFKLVFVMIIFPTILNITLYLIQDSFIKKSDFETTSLEIMLRFYEYFDASKYQNTQRIVNEPTIIEEKEIATGHYERHKYENDEDQGPPLLPQTMAGSIPSTNK